MNEDANERISEMHKFLRELGVSEKSLGKTFSDENDWTLVVKLHAYVEGSLNYLLLKHFGDSRLEDVISYLDISDRKRGKLAFVKALDLLPSEYRGFIQKFSELRNAVAHDVRNVDFNLKSHVENLDSKKLKALNDSMVPIIRDHFDGVLPQEQTIGLLKINARLAIFVCVAGIMRKIYKKEQINGRPIWELLFPDLPKPDESIPKEQ